MNFFSRALIPQRWRAVFNLNDPRRGRDSDNGEPRSQDGENNRPDDNDPWGGMGHNNRPQRPGRNGNSEGPPDLDELARELNRKIVALFGGKGGGRNSGDGNGGGFRPNTRGLGYVFMVVAALAFVFWAISGIFIVQEGRQAVITQFGRYKTTVGAGFNIRAPWPFQQHETVPVTQLRSVDIGNDSIIPATGLRSSGMLTLDENIVEIKFAVQYRLNDARAYLFESADPGRIVEQTAETAVREVVGKMSMDQVMAEERDQIAPRVLRLMQDILDRYHVGIEIVNINLQQGGVNPPQQVQAAFNDVLMATQERARMRNEAEAYANDVIPRADGAAARLMAEAEAYRAQVVARAEGDSERFKAVLAEYRKAPGVTRERMYIDTMQQIYSSVTKILVDSREGSNLLFLPLDKILQQQEAAAAAAAPAPAPAAPATPANTTTTPSGGNAATTGAAAPGRLDSAMRDLSRNRR